MSGSHKGGGYGGEGLNILCENCSRPCRNEDNIIILFSKIFSSIYDGVCCVDNLIRSDG